ncbi:transcriptional regulator [Enterococcus sp. C1]|uniref:TetR family transcriptional regulator n=1 Tax=unclassified Enterococcus TaxID=2608891 RepID=UPI000271E649|nr:TetR family transcriptional regulator [Enterococcus sp. C1]EPH88076.1 hypothetical protein D922_04062 [Enterococcus faecalis 06-MB-DW-09]MBF0015383.1 TetR/AcrR family transcriptional regulator [Enterococcus casseliflavus]GHU46589.1 hypothetical protein FACS1894194_4350 [Bacilli bacterium]EJF50743.1 transcriptional regulator [Enterococcus sp. C1]UOO46312.1 TetR family transcriptional regulator [Enterococcus casseliflavus]
MMEENPLPSTTFFHLKQEKKEKIDAVLLEEFFSKHISQVKVSAIVEKSHISRGAFYKYFQNLEDAYDYAITNYSNQIHSAIFTFINRNKNDFFKGIEEYLAWCSQWSPEDDHWKMIHLCTQSNAWTKRDAIPDDSPMIRQWLELLEENRFTIHDTQEAVSFLYFIMAVVMDSLTDFISNEWTAKELIKDFRYKVQWIKYGIKEHNKEYNKEE